MKTTDHLLLIFWKIITILVEIVVFGFSLVLNLFKAFFLLLRRFEFADSSFFRYWREIDWPYLFIGKLETWWKRFSEKMQDSAGFRRGAFMVFVLLAVFYYYPPSHWGPWRYYQSGVASFYSKGFWFKKTASGERFIPLFFTAAHKKLPLGTTVKVKNLENGKVVYVKINDRGPFVKGRIIDLSSSAAKKLGIFEPGTARVAVYTRKKY